jgi:hypothetical protein
MSTDMWLEKSLPDPLFGPLQVVHVLYSEISHFKLKNWLRLLDLNNLTRVFKFALRTSLAKTMGRLLLQGWFCWCVVGSVCEDGFADSKIGVKRLHIVTNSSSLFGSFVNFVSCRIFAMHLSK